MIQNDDTISRQAAINKLNERQRKLIYCFGFENDMVKIMDIAKSIVIAMPSAQHERKTGEWIPHKSIFGGLGEKVYACNQCGYNIGFHTENFCPSCGADMREGQNG